MWLTRAPSVGAYCLCLQTTDIPLSLFFIQFCTLIEFSSPTPTLATIIFPLLDACSQSLPTLTTLDHTVGSPKPLLSSLIMILPPTDAS